MLRRCFKVGCQLITHLIVTPTNSIKPLFPKSQWGKPLQIRIINLVQPLRFHKPLYHNVRQEDQITKSSMKIKASTLSTVESFQALDQYENQRIWIQTMNSECLKAHQEIKDKVIQQLHFSHFQSITKGIQQIVLKIESFVHLIDQLVGWHALASPMTIQQFPSLDLQPFISQAYVKIQNLIQSIKHDLGVHPTVEGFITVKHQVSSLSLQNSSLSSKCNNSIQESY